ncbi:MAG: multiprotein bridging factor aMBF1 [Candidatus Freyarchaeum deiterrae]
MCEVCGQKIIGKGKYVNIEGANLIVCENCERFGDSSRISVTRPPKPKINKITSPPKIMTLKKPKTKSFVKKDFLPNSYELVDDYMDKIRKAREEKGLSHEELAKKINERVSIIKKIETGKMYPSEKIIRKLEKELQIDIYTPLDSKDEAVGTKEDRKGLTLGDVVNIKKKNSNNIQQ